MRFRVFCFVQKIIKDSLRKREDTRRLQAPSVTVIDIAEALLEPRGLLTGVRPRLAFTLPLCLSPPMLNPHSINFSQIVSS